MEFIVKHVCLVGSKFSPQCFMIIEKLCFQELCVEKGVVLDVLCVYEVNQDNSNIINPRVKFKFCRK